LRSICCLDQQKNNVSDELRREYDGGKSEPNKLKHKERNVSLDDNCRKEGDNSEKRRRGKHLPTPSGANQIQVGEQMEPGRGFKR